MWPIVTDRVSWFVGLYVGRSVCDTSEPCKTAKPIEMSFGLRTRVGVGNHVLDGGPDTPWEGAIFEGERKYRDSSVICEKTAEPIEMPFELWARMDRRNHVLDAQICSGTLPWQPIL